jgi:uncharacterized membrane protein YidH (DUF202 family)
MMRLFDPGLQPERTELAWRRTALAIGVGSLVAMRLLPVAFSDPWWILVGASGLLVAGTLWIVARRRGRRTVEMLLTRGDRAPLPGAGPLAFLAAFVIVCGAIAFAVVVTAVGSG